MTTDFPAYLYKDVATFDDSLAGRCTVRLIATARFRWLEGTCRVALDFDRRTNPDRRAGECSHTRIVSEGVSSISSFLSGLTNEVSLNGRLWTAPPTLDMPRQAPRISDPQDPGDTYFDDEARDGLAEALEGSREKAERQAAKLERIVDETLADRGGWEVPEESRAALRKLAGKVPGRQLTELELRRLSGDDTWQPPDPEPPDPEDVRFNFIDPPG